MPQERNLHERYAVESWIRGRECERIAFEGRILETYSGLLATV